MNKTAIVVGRFQIDLFHEGYRSTFNEIFKNGYRKLIIVLGCAPTRLCDDNPVPFEVRKQLLEYFLRDTYKGLEFSIVKIGNFQDDHVWSTKLDQIVEIFGLSGNEFNFIVGRDSFKPYYSGKYLVNFETLVTDQDSYSSTRRREEIGRDPNALHCSTQLEAQIVARTLIWASQYLYPMVFSTVDMAIFNNAEDSILFGRKANEKYWRLPGGFVDPTDRDKTSAALRELNEECKIDASWLEEFKIVNTFKVSDWRYAKTKHRIITTLFQGKLDSSGYKPEAGDDIVELRWLKIEDLGSYLYGEKGNDFELFEAHKALVEALI